MVSYRKTCLLQALELSGCEGSFLCRWFIDVSKCSFSFSVSLSSQFLALSALLSCYRFWFLSPGRQTNLQFSSPGIYVSSHGTFNFSVSLSCKFLALPALSASYSFRFFHLAGKQTGNFSSPSIFTQNILPSSLPADGSQVPTRALPVQAHFPLSAIPSRVGDRAFCPAQCGWLLRAENGGEDVLVQVISWFRKWIVSPGVS